MADEAPDSTVAAIAALLRALPGATLRDPAPVATLTRAETLLGRPLPADLRAFFLRHDGGALGPDCQLLGLDEAMARLGAGRTIANRSPLWPVAERGGRRFALDGSSGAPWPVVELGEKSADRVATSFERFLAVLADELAAGDRADALVRAERRCDLDPEHAEHWAEAAELHERAGRFDVAARCLREGVARARPVTASLHASAAVRAAGEGDTAGARAAIEAALTGAVVGGRDEDACLDAAALLLVLAEESGDADSASRARRLLGDNGISVASFWRMEALGALSVGNATRADLALRLAGRIQPDDPDLGRLRTPAVVPREALVALLEARERLEAGRPEEATTRARAAVRLAPDLGIAHAVLAESLNAVRNREAEAVARRATELNPALVDGWRELGDACFEASELPKAEVAFRRMVAIDPSYGLGHAKLAQVMLEMGRPVEALDAIGAAETRDGDPFFVAAIRGDIYSAMDRDAEAADSYERALDLAPDDHWALHQAALSHSHAGHDGRAQELFEAALRTDEGSCPQTFVDYADFLRRLGRYGDAVKLLRRAVAAVPTDPEWKQALKEAERELASAPN